jgi:hypothetical protein
MGSPRQTKTHQQTTHERLLYKTGVPKELSWLSCLEPQVIIQRYNSVIIGLANFYLGYVRNRASIHHWIYILRFSCLKILAQKYKTSIRDIFKRFGVKLHSKNRQTVQVKVRIKNGEEFFEKPFTLLSYRDLIDRYLKQKKNIKASRQRYYDVEKDNIINEYPHKGGNIPRVTNEDYLEKISLVSLRTMESHLKGDFHVWFRKK